MRQISEKEIIKRFSFDNPWWADSLEAFKNKSAFAQLPRRFYFHPFSHLVTKRGLNRAIVLMGPRRVGKTVMLHHTILELLERGIATQNILYISLDTPVITGRSLDSLLQLFVEMHPARTSQELYVFFDEVQYFKDWEVHLKSLVDSYPGHRFVVSGSSAAALRLKSHESGAGRFTNFLLPPLSFAEYLNFIGLESKLIRYQSIDDDKNEYETTNIHALNSEFINYINYGGYPEAVFLETIRQSKTQFIKSDIIDKVLLRDLPSLYGISDIQELNRLFSVLAYNSGQEVSLDNLASSSGVAKGTLKRYMEYLEAAFLTKRICRIDQNAKRFKRERKFKIFLTNPSMRAALFGDIDPGDDDTLGTLCETAIVGQWAHSNDDDTFCYARWKHGEIDLVYMGVAEQNPRWYVEVKWSDRTITHLSEIDPLIDFILAHSNRENPSLLVTSKTTNTIVEYRGVTVEFSPSSLYAYTVGRNLIRHLEVEVGN